MRNSTRNALAKRAIEEYLERENYRFMMFEEARQAIIEYEETGLHITLDEFGNWVDQLDSNNPSPIPQCHT